MTQFIRKIDENTSVPLKVVGAIVVAALGISAQLFAIKRDLDELKQGAFWTVENQEVWASELRRGNPQLSVPRAREGFVMGTPGSRLTGGTP